MTIPFVLTSTFLTSMPLMAVATSDFTKTALVSICLCLAAFFLIGYFGLVSPRQREAKRKRTIADLCELLGTGEGEIPAVDSYINSAYIGEQAVPTEMFKPLRWIVLLAHLVPGVNEVHPAFAPWVSQLRIPRKQFSEYLRQAVSEGALSQRSNRKIGAEPDAGLMFRPLDSPSPAVFYPGGFSADGAKFWLAFSRQVAQRAQDEDFFPDPYLEGHPANWQGVYYACRLRYEQLHKPDPPFRGIVDSER